MLQGVRDSGSAARNALESEVDYSISFLKRVSVLLASCCCGCYVLDFRGFGNRCLVALSLFVVFYIMCVSIVVAGVCVVCIFVMGICSHTPLVSNTCSQATLDSCIRLILFG